MRYGQLTGADLLCAEGGMCRVHTPEQTYGPRWLQIANVPFVGVHTPVHGSLGLEGRVELGRHGPPIDGTELSHEGCHTCKRGGNSDRRRLGQKG